MEAINASEPLQHLLTATKTPIADLTPDLVEAPSRAVHGVVTITWPYNSVKGTFSFILAEPDYRLRRNNGQVRINLTGSSAKNAAESGLSSGDAIILSLEGAEWEPEQFKKRQSLPGAGIDWQLKFSERLVLLVTLDETKETRLVVVDHPPPVELPHPVEVPPTETIHVEDWLPEGNEAFTTPSKTHISKFKDGEYESPAFIKRARTSYGSLFEDGYDIFEDDGGVKGRGRKRTRFGRDSGAWRYSSQSPSPEPTMPQDRSSSPLRPETTDEGCQTMELDFSMSLPEQATEKPTNSQHSLIEEQVINQAGIVDHGVQSDFHDEWPTTTPASLPSFDPNGSFTSSTPAIPTFQPSLEFGTPSGHFQPVWNPRPVDLAPDGYSHIVEPPPPPHSFSNTYGDERSVEVGVMRSGSPTRSPSEPNHLAVEDIGQPPNDDLLADEHSYPMPAAPQSTVYPPLDLDDEERSSLAPRGSHLDYPPSYLDDKRPFSQEAMDVERGPFGASIPAAANAGSGSWAPINNPSQAASMPSTDRLDSAEGASPDNAVVIDESDSDGDPPPPTGAEDTVMDDRADGVEMYEDLEVEDEVDAEFSDEDEPEYDPDEMGGDYDTRNYVGPDDDEDDSHDEDLQSHNLEPEFNDYESWEEGEEDDENLDYESEYEMDDVEPQRPPQPIVQSTPPVIDLISSSEDEGEDDTAESPQPSRAALDNTSQRQPISMPRNMSPEQVARSQSESEEQSEEEDGDELFNEDEAEDDEGAEMQDEVASSDRPRSQSPVSEDEYVDDPLEKEQEDVEDGTGDEEVAAISDLDPQADELEHQQDDKIATDQEGSPQANRTGVITHDENGDTIMKEGEVDASQSAAEGLEILSRAVDDESNANNRATSPENVQGDIAITVETNVPSMNTALGLEEQLEEHTTQDAQEDDTVDMIPTLPSIPSDLPTMLVDDDTQEAIITPSSPTLTHSFVSQLGDEEKVEIVMQEANTTTESAIPTDQLPTPRDTQLAVDATISHTVATASPELGEPVGISTHEVITEQLIDTLELSVATENTVTPVEGHPLEPVAVHRQDTPSENVEEITQPKHAVVSPSLSFQTQVDADDITQATFIALSPKVSMEVETGVEAHSDIGADASTTNVSFMSQMEIDEELQASIMEYSQDFDEETDSKRVNMDETSDRPEVDESEADTSQDEDEIPAEPEIPDVVSRGPSPELGNLAEELPHGQQAIAEVASVDTPDYELETDPSVQLARAANASRRGARQQELLLKQTHAQRKSLPAREIPTPEVEDSSVQLARASLNKAFQAEEDSSSMTGAKLMLVRHLRDELPECTSLKVLRQYLQKKLDVIAVAMMQPPEPQRAKGGPREYMMSFTITDHSIGPYSVVEVQLYRPHKETLPIVKAGDVVLLRNFTVISLQSKGFGLRTNDESSWAVFDHEDQPAQIKGPPVEYGEKETAYVAHMRAWFNLLDEKAQEKLERANKKIVDAGSRSK
ncbi:hypothetical protein F4818DRAFT_413437 [Hypoxylon cercidicola]|nr:hypothetical protein F4818DRAFT_413437 [Hypoxylon cercidicola]